MYILFPPCSERHAHVSLHLHPQLVSYTAECTCLSNKKNLPPWFFHEVVPTIRFQSKKSTLNEHYSHPHVHVLLHPVMQKLFAKRQIILLVIQPQKRKFPGGCNYPHAHTTLRLVTDDPQIVGWKAEYTAFCPTKKRKTMFPGVCFYPCSHPHAHVPLYIVIPDVLAKRQSMLLVI